MRKFLRIFAIVAVAALPATALSQQKDAPPAQGQGMMGQGMPGGGMMCPMMGMGGMGMMGGMGSMGMMGGMSADPKTTARMMEMRGEMMMRMGEVMMKYGKQMEKGEMK